MVRHKYPYLVPRDELLFIEPEPRKKLFINMLENYKIYCPGMTLEYAYLNVNSQYPVDYVVVFNGMTTDKRPIVLWRCPYLYSWESIPGYRYAVKNNLHEQFFKEEGNTMCKITRGRFNEFITTMCHLPLNEWKNPEYAETVMDNLSALALRYNPDAHGKKPGSPNR